MIRVVVFGGGPAWDYGMKEFLCRLDENPEIDLVGVFCQPGEQNLAARIRDLLKRRGLLMFPLILYTAGHSGWKRLCHPRECRALDNRISRLSGRLFSVNDIHASEVLRQVRMLQPDLGAAYGSPVLRSELFTIPTHGTLGIHHGKAPEYRGKKTTFWAIYNGEAAAAVIIQKIGSGLDTGLIVREATVPIGRHSYRTVMRNLEVLGVRLYVEAILDVSRGTASYAPQIGRRGTLYRDPRLPELVCFAWKQFRNRILHLSSGLKSHHLSKDAS